MRSRALVLAVGVCGLAAGIAGCGGSSSGGGGTNAAGGGSGTSAVSTTSSPDNGVAAKSPDAIVAAAFNAAVSAKSVHFSGSGKNGGTRVSLDLTLVPGKGGSGELNDNGLDFRFTYLNQTVYINGSDSFWKRATHGNNAAVQLFHGKWLKTPATDPNFGAVTKFADARTLFTGILKSGHGKLVKGATTTISGQKVVALNDTRKKGTLYVATTGKPYPIEISSPTEGHFVFDRYDQPVSLTAPANAIDATQLEKLASS